MPSIIIDNFSGKLTRHQNGAMNSGFVKHTKSYGYEPFSKPMNLTWFETSSQIDPNGAVITDLIMCGKERVESGISYVYAVGHTGRIYKIQVNDPTTYNPNYDNPVLLTTITSGTPTFTRGGFIDFYGVTERMYIGHDKGVTRLDFDGTNETVVGNAGSWTQTVPRPMMQFVGKLYVGTGSNLAEIDTTGSVTTYAKILPSFPSNTQVRDLDISPDGNYLHLVVSRLPLPDITATTQDTSFLSNSESYVFKWNGTDAGYTSFNNFPSFSLNTNTIFGDSEYKFGYDIAGACMYDASKKTLSLIYSQAPLPTSVGSNGNILGWITSEFSNGFSKASHYLYGPLDKEFSDDMWYQVFSQGAKTPETDVIRVPFFMIVSNFGIGQSTNGYIGGVFSSGKIYFSTLETSTAPTTKYRFYKFFSVPTTIGTAMGGIYETQTQLFSEKIATKELRVYTEPLVTNNSFQIDFIGSDGNVIPNSTQTFTVGTNVNAGDDIVRATPDINQTYALGLRVTNLGSKNMTFKKVEIDYEEDKS